MPSFSLEQNLSKLDGTNLYRTHVDTNETDESRNFVKIARGCRVNTLTMTANENEEVKMTLDLKLGMFTILSMMKYMMLEEELLMKQHSLIMNLALMQMKQENLSSFPMEHLNY